MDTRKQPMNLQGLLRFALEYTKAEDPSHPSSFELLDDEKKQFLESALKSMTIDVIKEFEKAIAILEDLGSTDQKILDALSKIRDFTDNIDFANNFVKVEGTKILLKHLRSGNSQIRIASINIIAEMSQNNPFCQKHFIESDILSTLILYLKDGEDIASSALYGISSLIRSFEPGLKKFLEMGGIDILLLCLNTHHPRILVKTSFLIACLSSEYSSVRDLFAKKLAIKKLSDFLEPISGFDVKLEACLYAMCEISKSPLLIQQPNDKNLVHTLQNIIDLNKDLPQSEEIVTYADNVLKNLSHRTPSLQ